MNWLSRILLRRAARRMSVTSHQAHRERVRAKARQLCAEMGREVPDALR